MAFVGFGGVTVSEDFISDDLTHRRIGWWGERMGGDPMKEKKQFLYIHKYSVCSLAMHGPW